jgi:hypothetical protein
VTDRNDYLARRSRDLRANVSDVVREPISRVRCGPRELAIALATGHADPFIELALWSPQGPPSERRMVERGRANLLLREVDQLIAELQKARARLGRPAR